MSRSPRIDFRGFYSELSCEETQQAIPQQTERHLTMSNDTERQAFWQAPYWCPPSGPQRLEQLEQLVAVADIDRYHETYEWIRETPRTGREAAALHLHLWQTLNRRKF